MAVCPQCRTGYPTDVTNCPLDGAPLAQEPRAEPRAEPPAELPAAASARDEDATDPLVGATLAERYRITRRIGYGGMGVVYEATHAVIGKTVAVKVLHERLAPRREVAARLMNEARLASSIRNEHIVDIFDFGETSDGRTFVVMELLDGESLAAVIHREGPLPEQRATAVCLQVSDALGAAHERGVIHRDVKPENIFLSRRDGADFVKVLDFGVSKTIRPGAGDEQLRLTHTGMVLGTPLYMSPEQARGEEQIDHRIDVYALGVILYECLTAETPFRGTNYLGIISDVLSRTPLAPRQRRPDLRISPSVEQVVARAMAHDRNERYPSMVELGVDLRRVQAGQVPVAVEAASTAAARVRVRRRLLFAAMGAIAVVVVVLTSVLTSSNVSATAPAESATAAAVMPATTTLAIAPPPSPVPSTVPSTVIVQIDTDPPAAEIFDGPRSLGVGGEKIAFQRADSPVDLRVHLEGYNEAHYKLVPRVDGERVAIQLSPLAPPPPPSSSIHHSHAHAAAKSAKGPVDPPPARDPYHPRR